ncbi:hypothetical protein IW137_002329 [Coemansia sp. RSA 1287]|nr:hypothetical protein IW137_002329 [Coemansia sp. RSA 1287]
MNTNTEQAATAPQMVTMADFQTLASVMFAVRAKLDRQQSGAKDSIESLLKVVPPFAGNDMAWSAMAWETAARKCVTDFVQGVSEYSLILLLKQRLTGPDAIAMAALNLDTLDKFFATLKSTFSAVAYSDLVCKAIESGAFLKVCPSTSGLHAYNVYYQLKKTNANEIMLVDALAWCDNALFRTLQVYVDKVNTETVAAARSWQRWLRLFAGAVAVFLPSLMRGDSRIFHAH